MGSTRDKALTALSADSPGKGTLNKDTKSNPMRFRDFLRQWDKLTFTEYEKHSLIEGFGLSLGMFAILYAFLTAPDFFIASYVSPHASKILVIGSVFCFLSALRWQYFEWRKRATGILPE